MAVFYSFHYDRDSWRVQQVMNMGKIEGQPLPAGRYGRGTGDIPNGFGCDGRIIWDGTASNGSLVPAGVYLLRMRADGADIVVFNPEKKQRLSVSTLHMKVDYNPYEGREVTGVSETGFAWGGTWVRADGMHFEWRAGA